MKRNKIIDHKSGLLIAFCVAGVGIIVIVLTAVFVGSSQSISMYIGYALMFASIIIKRVTWRCPHCRNPFPMQMIKLPSRCFYCGKDL